MKKICKSRAVAYKKCRAYLIKQVVQNGYDRYGWNFKKELFDSDYISIKIDLMLNLKDGNPTEAIGKVKEPIEKLL